MNTISIVAENLIGAYSKMTFKPCKFGCDILVEVRQTAAGWRPFEEAGNMHDCPKSPYNQQNRNHKPKQQMIEPTEEEWKNLQQDKDDHGNETVYDMSPPKPKQEFVDHTVSIKSHLKYKTITDPSPEGFDLKLNDFAETHNIHYTQTHIAGSLYVAVVMYEELK